MSKVTFFLPPPLSLCALQGGGGVHDMTGMRDASCTEEESIYWNGVTTGVLEGKSLSKSTDWGFPIFVLPTHPYLQDKHRLTYTVLTQDYKINHIYIVMI